MSKLTNGVERSRKRRKLSPQLEAEKASLDKGNHNEQSVDENSTLTVLPPLKDLASSEPSLRRAALKNIIAHIEQRPVSSSLSSVECLQLWKGFFVAIYMHDSKNAISVQNMLKQVASTFHLFDEKDSEIRQLTNERKLDGQAVENDWLRQYHAAFWQTLVKEWAGIDSHRMNKYLLLVRFVMRELATICLRSVLQNDAQGGSTSKSGTSRKRKSTINSKEESAISLKAVDSTKTKSIINVLQADGPLNTKDRKISDGLRLHLLDIYATEVFAALSVLLEESTGETSKRDSLELQEMLDTLKLPISEMSQSDSGAPKNVRTKAKEALGEFELKREEIKLSS